MNTTARIRGHLRSNVIGYVALFFALSGGVAWATHPGGANTISTGDIVNDQVFTQDLANNNMTSLDIRDDTLGSGGLQAIDLRDDSVGTSEISSGAVRVDELGTDAVGSDEVHNDSLKGTDIDEGSLNAAEGLHEVGASGEPQFNAFNGHCDWGNYGGGHQSVAFYKDSDRVYLKGLADAVDTSINGCDFFFAEDSFIFVLPPGYRPPARSVHVMLANDRVGRINIDPDGAVRVEAAAASTDNYQTYTSLDGISFRIG